MVRITDIFERINPDKLPIDIIEENEDYTLLLYNIQLQNFKTKVHRSKLGFLSLKNYAEP